MLKKRLIPCLFLKNGYLVRSEKFTHHQILGNAIHQVERFNKWEVDELIYIDISEDENYEIRRDDQKVKSEMDILKILQAVSKTCFVPLTFGGRIRSIEDIQKRLSSGADKVTINTIAIQNPEFITQAANIFGSQCIIVSIDFKKNESGKNEVYSDHGRKSTGLDVIEWAKEAERRGCGEIFLNSIERDGMAQGYDLALLKEVAESVKIPVIACGGAGTFKHMGEAIIEGRADAVAAGNIFHFTELSTKMARKQLIKMGVPVRN